MIDAREEFARDYVLLAIKANSLCGGGDPCSPRSAAR